MHFKFAKSANKKQRFFYKKTSTWDLKAQTCMLISNSEMWVLKSQKNYTNYFEKMRKDGKAQNFCLNLNSA
jgi:hypothetical protein